MNTFKNSLFFVYIFFNTQFVISQVNIIGEVKNTDGDPIINANILLKGTNITTNTDELGVFRLKNVDQGMYVIIISRLGYKTYQKSVETETNDIFFQVILEDDLLNLQTVVVTGTLDPRLKIESSTAVSTIESNGLKQVFPRGTASVLGLISGTFIDASAGEVFTKVYNRGISASAEDDLGWYYVSLQEDGLPVSLVQHSYFSPDIFHRLDLTTKRIEAIRGGSASITALNAPGGIYNFISQGIRNELSGEIQLQSGIQGEENLFHRMDAFLGGPLGNKWFFTAGGHYRQDDGARNTSFIFSKGGQFKFNLIKENNSGYFKFYGKILNDYTNRWTGVAATNWNNPQPAFGQDFGTTSLLMPAFNANIPDGRNLSNGKTNRFDPSRGVHAKDIAFGIDLLQDLGNDWSIRHNVKLSKKNANWQTSISNAFVSLNDPTAYFISDTSGSTFPIGQVVFRNAQSGSELARIDNSGILAGKSFKYLTSGVLPNDAIMGTSAWFKQNKADEWMNQLTIRKQWVNHDFTTGISSGFSDIYLFTQGSFAYVTYEPNPRMLQVTLENLNEPVIALSDLNGISNYGGLFFVNADANVKQLATFANDRWKLSNRFHLDMGLRFETISHKGSKDRFAPNSQYGGVDGNINTAYDNSVLVSTGEKDNFDFNYNYLSYSVGLNYQLNEVAAVFARFSKGNKAPELNYYFNNFSNVAFNGKGAVQKISQAELGVKWSLKKFSFTGTLFWSQLTNIGVSNFEFDLDNNSVFYTPIQFNASRVFGLEWESAYSPFRYWTFRFDGALQNPKATTWMVYDAAGSVDTSDDSIIDYSGNILPFNHKLMFNISSEYNNNDLSAFIKWQFTGKREGNAANAFQLSNYSIFNAGVGYKINKHWSANMLVTNLFNSEGLANFLGANSFGASSNGVTKEYTQANPDASFIVVPILPRGTLLRLNYLF